MTTSINHRNNHDYYFIDAVGKHTGPYLMGVKQAVECGLKMNRKDCIDISPEIRAVLDTITILQVISEYKNPEEVEEKVL